MNEYIDIYCERLEPGLWAEPLNALSNLAFFLAAWFAFALARDRDAVTRDNIVLIALIFVIGAGSTLFHTYATVWAKFADTIPIVLFQIFFLFTYARRIMEADGIMIALMIGGFFGLSFIAGSLPYDWFNGSLGYAPALIFLAGLGVYHYKMRKNEPFILWVTACVFLLSLTFRSFDMAVCDWLSIGLHYFWHILNGIVLYLSARAVIVNTHKVSIEA